MKDLSTIRVIPFCGKSEEWPIWSDLLIGKLSIPKSDKVFDEGKKKAKIIELKEIA